MPTSSSIHDERKPAIPIRSRYVLLLTVNGLSVILRTLRALFNQTIKEKKLSRDYYPFEEYRIKKENTRKRAISLEDIIRIKNYESQTHRHERAKHYFLISFYLMGLGHSSEGVTQIYLDSFDKGTMDKYHRIVIDV